MSERPITPSQTVGPFFAYCLTPRDYGIAPLVEADLVGPGAIGAPIRIEGRVVDGEDAPVPDAMIEIWQADGAGRYPTSADNSGFGGFGRAGTDAQGRFAFATIKPGPVPGPDGAMQAPHIAVSVFARGLLTRLVTRIYFPDEPANEEDPILARVPQERRGTLVARAGEDAYLFDIRLQGRDETVFFEV